MPRNELVSLYPKGRDLRAGRAVTAKGDGVDRGVPPAATSPYPAKEPLRPSAALLINDLVCRRLLEGIVVNLDLEATMVEESEVAAGRICEFEMIIADEAEARRLRPIIEAEQTTCDSIKLR